jgi:membrane fusion protein (multidrug efflux system)
VATPPAEVGVIEVKKADVPLPLTYAGSVAGFRNVEIRPQVSGTILKREFIEGAKVKQGDVLFRINPRTYQAALDRATAQLGQLQATSVQAEENFNRIQELSQKQVATAKQLEDAQAARDLARRRRRLIVRRDRLFDAHMAASGQAGTIWPDAR